MKRQDIAGDFTQLPAADSATGSAPEPSGRDSLTTQIEKVRRDAIQPPTDTRIHDEDKLIMEPRDRAIAIDGTAPEAPLAITAHAHVPGPAGPLPVDHVGPAGKGGQVVVARKSAGPPPRPSQTPGLTQMLYSFRQPAPPPELYPEMRDGLSPSRPLTHPLHANRRGVQ